jgi:hypothetical protein
MSFFSWIPPQRLLEISFSDPRLFADCLPLIVLCCLGASKRWARFTDSPLVFAIVYGSPFFLLTFQDSLGDSTQFLEGIHARYYMSEFASTWTHYWLFRLLHEPFNVGAKFVIAFSSRLAGLVYLWAVAKTSIRLFPNLEPQRRLAYRLMFFTAGVTLMFYGYVENTPLALPAEQVWVLASIGFLLSPSFYTLFKCSLALAFATAFHGRIAFLVPAFILACCIPAGSSSLRFKRVLFGGGVYFAFLAAAVAYIVFIDFRHIAGSLYGNALGGGNGRMFVPGHLIIARAHWQPILEGLFLAGGVLVPCGLVAAGEAVFNREPILLWALGYLCSSAVYVFFWEFDFGPFLDWDLVFSAVGPLLLLAGVRVARSKVPIVLLVPFMTGSAYMTMAFGAILNGGPLTLNVVPRAAAPVAHFACSAHGLKRTYFSDSGLTTPIGIAETDIPDHQYEPTGTESPNSGRPFGAVFEGYLWVPSSGRYRFFIRAQGNFRLRIAHRLLFERWTGFEWRITSERVLSFSKSGWYPIRLEFFSRVEGFWVRLGIESATRTKSPVTMEELCHD